MFCCLKEYGRGCCCKYLYVLDFDNTIVNGNSDTEILKLLRNKPIPPEVRSVFDGNNWHIYMSKILEYLYECGFTTQDILGCVQKMTMAYGMEQLMQTLQREVKKKKRRKNHFVVVSDSNDLFIRSYLSNLNPPIEPTAIISNHGDIGDDGRIRLRPYHIQKACEICPYNLCKGQALQQYIDQFGKFHRVVFVADGGNDICLANRLTSSDIVFVRKWYRMHKAILRGTYRTEPINIKALVRYYYEGTDIEFRLFCAPIVCNYC